MDQFRLKTYRQTTIGLVALLTLGFLFLRVQPRPQAISSLSRSSERLSTVEKATLKQLVTHLPLAFEINKGQDRPDVMFLARAAKADLRLTSNEATLLTGTARFRMRFAGANSIVNVKGDQELGERRNYFLGNDTAKWRTDVPTFRRVIYQNLYTGINLTYYGNNKEIEYDFEVAPGADPRAIRLAFDRQVHREISDNGDLLLRAVKAELVERKPQIYQE